MLIQFITFQVLIVDWTLRSGRLPLLGGNRAYFSILGYVCMLHLVTIES